MQHLDIAPTLLDACGLQRSRQMEGTQSVAACDRRRAQQGGWERVYCCESTWQSKWAVRTQDIKFILARQPDRHHMPMRELYDLTKDPD